jgi:integrase
MAQTPRQEVERLKERIQNDERDIDDEADREQLIEFSRQLDLRKEEYSDHRHLKLLRHLTRIAENVGGLADALEDKKAAEDIVQWINTTYDNEETNRDYRVALRVFGKRVAPDDDGDPPGSIDWISSKTSRDYNPTPNPADMLELDDDVKPMIEAARNPRDKALIGVQYEAGFRGGELYDLTIGDVSDADEGLGIRVDGKTGQRTVHLTAGFSIHALQRWLSEHPAPDDPDAPLWSKLNKPEQYSYQRFLQCFEEAAERADVTKPVTPTNFRKSNAYWLAKKRDANAALIEDRQGRKRGSDAVSRYIARFGEDTEKQYARLMGKEVEESEPTDRSPVECPRCTRETPRDEPKCMWCGQVLDYEAAQEIRAEQEEVRKAALRLVKSNPELVDDIEAARDLETVFENNPELFEEVQEFRDALSDD